MENVATTNRRVYLNLLRCKTKHLVELQAKQSDAKDLNENLTPAFHRIPRLKVCKNRKPLSVVKPQYRKSKRKLPQNRTKNNPKPHDHKPLRPPLSVQNNAKRNHRFLDNNKLVF